VTRERRRAELLAKVSGLSSELASWRALSVADGPMETHHTQLAALTSAFGPELEALEHRIEREDLDRTWTTIEDRISGLNELWDFYRRKFVLRQSAIFQPYLRLADEFGWLCYEPARRLAATVPREPPLAFLSAGTSPFAVPRGAPTKEPPRLDRLARSGPVPLIGIPWAQLRHVPDVVILGHEIGHVVQYDFELTGTLGALLAEAKPEHWPTWRRRMAEMFADVYGTLAGGAAFARAMADFTATNAASRGGTATYPPADFRLRLIAATRALMSGAEPGDSGPAERIAERFVHGPYPEFGGLPLTAVLGLDEPPVQETAYALRNGLELRHDIDVRQLVAAATLAFHDAPVQYAAGDLTGEVLTHARALLSKGLRAESPDQISAELHRRSARLITDLLDGR